VRVRTHDLDEATQATTGASILHKTELVSPRERFDYLASLVRLKHIALGCVSERGRLNICAGPSSSSFLVRLGLGGVCEHRLAGEIVLLGDAWAVVQSPDDLATIRTDEFFQTIGLTIREAAIASELEKLLGHPLGARITFEPGMNMRTVLGQRFRHEAIQLCLGLDRTFGHNPEPVLAIQETERSLVTLLIEGHRHNYTRLLNRQTSAGPWQVRAAEEFIREYADQPLSLGDLAVVAGVSARTLQFSFRKHRRRSPMQFLRDARLDRVRAELLTPDNHTSVTATAAQWGFLHFGRFAAHYEKRYGEAPSRSLRRGKAFLSQT